MKRQRTKRWLAGFLSVVTVVSMTLGQTPATMAAINSEKTADTQTSIADTQPSTDYTQPSTEYTQSETGDTQTSTDETQNTTDDTQYSAAGTQPVTYDVQQAADGTQPAIAVTQFFAEDVTSPVMSPVPEGTPEESDPGAGEPVLQDLGGSMDINSILKMNVTYIGEEDDYNITKTNDFNLKYQADFNIKTNIEAGLLTIRIPRTLFTKRDGSAVMPNDIGVPMGMPGSYAENKVTPFNYYIDGNELVFFNYKKLTQGTVASFQVAYNGVKAMDVTDMTTWSLTPALSLSPSEGWGALTCTSPALTGTVDTSVAFSSANKSAFIDVGPSNITPELYTEKQVKKYLYNNELPAAFSGNNFNNYVYMVWEMGFTGQATQPWNLYATEIPDINGSNAGQVVGFNYPSVQQGDRYRLTLSDVRETDMAELYRYKPLHVITAYPKANVPNGTKLGNTVTFTAEPVDGKDSASTAKANAYWAYREFKFNYPEGTEVNCMDKMSKIPETNRLTDDIQTYSGLLEQYRLASQKGRDTDALGYVSRSIIKTYLSTHNVNQSSPDFGKYIPNTWEEITTVDDVMQMRDDQGNLTMLGKDDYYYTSVKITQADQGLDPWEGEAAPPEEVSGVDRSVYIYAWYKDGTGWELVKTVPWAVSGEMFYMFEDSALQRQPWRIKVVHNAVDDLSACTIDVNVALRANSPKIQGMLNAGATALWAEDLSGVLCKAHKENGTVQWLNEDNAGDVIYAGNTNLQSTTSGLYGGLIQRDLSSIRMTGLEKDAAAFKSGTAANDAVNARVNLQYNLTAYESYLLYSSEAIRELTFLGTQGPNHRELVFYDLLPLGVKYDPSVEIKAGRITDLDSGGYYKDKPDTWDSSQVSATVDSSADIIQNYNGTGRTRVAIHVHYDGADPSVFTSQKWLAGWGVSFGAYYDWKDIELCKNSENISVFMPEAGDNTALLGTDEQVARDNGVVVPDSMAAVCGPFGSDIDGDSNTGEQNVLYAETVAAIDVSQANESKILKTVKADDDRFGTYEESASVKVGSGYSYDITISNTMYSLKDIVIFDRVEYASNDHDPNETGIEETSWKGTFAGLQLASLKKLGIAPVVYYNENENAAVSEGTASAASVLTAANGWYTEAAWNAAGKTLEQVRSFAVDVSHTDGGGEFVLTNNSAISMQVKMISPASLQTQTYAYNNARYYSYNVEDNQARTGRGNTARVTLSESNSLEVVKTLEGEVPESQKDSSFTFNVKKGEKPYATKEYTLWTLQTDGTYVPQTGRIYTTTASGTFKLKAGQKAVFALTDITKIKVTEAESPFWEQSLTTDDTHIAEGLRTLHFTNKYRPVLYAQKRLLAVPGDVDTTGEEFTYQVLNNGQPVADTEFWYVTSARTDGGTPDKDTTKGTDGVGRTDANGCFKIKAGDIIVLSPGKINDTYTLKEPDPGENWICLTNTVEGTLPINGAKAEITNIYKWKTLNLIKKLTHQDAAECAQAFTFRIEVDGKPFANKPWTLLKVDETPAVVVSTGTTNANGELTAHCAGKLLQIPGIAAESTVKVTETNSGEDYEPDNAELSATMPLYAVSRNMTITNDYLYRDLSVTKQVSYDNKAADAAAVEADLETHEFTMTARIGDEPGEPLSNTRYTITKGGETVGMGTTAADGSFKIKQGQTVTFTYVAKEGTAYRVTETQDANYPQLVPENNAPISGKLGNENATVTFLNGRLTDFVIEKKVVLGDDTGGKAAAKVTAYNTEDKNYTRDKAEMTLKVNKTDGTVYTWPETDTNVTVTYPVGAFETVQWKAGSSFAIPYGAKVVIPGGLDGVSYRLYEAKESQHTLSFDGNTVIVSKQVYPEDDDPVRGDTADSKKATVTNEISAYDIASKVNKKMVDGSGLKDGDKLFYEVQRYDGTNWKPAEGIPYVRSMDSDPGTIPVPSGDFAQEIETTQADGRIEIHYVGGDTNQIPGISFIKDIVKPYYTEPKNGDLRVIERPDLSDASFGMLSGYIDKDGKEMDTISNDAAGFINDSSSRTIEITKEMSDGSTGADTYTFYLEQVLAAADKPVTDKSQILETHAWPGMAYTIYNTETGASEGSGKTDASGAVCLKAGQYASLSVPKETAWTVTEKDTAMTRLTGLSGTEGDTTKLGDNLMLIPAMEINHIPHVTDITITTTEVKKIMSGVIQAVDRFEDGDYQNKRKISDESNGFSDGLNIPAYYYDNEDGNYYHVIGIGTGAFSSKEITGALVLPDSVESVGDAAFAATLRVSSITLGKGLKTIGMYAFWKMTYGNYGSSKYIDINIPDSVETIGSQAFAENILGSIQIGSKEGGSKLTKLEISTFKSCRFEDGSTVKLYEGVREIGRLVFDGSRVIGDPGKMSIYIPATMETIYSDAFGNGPFTSINIAKPKDGSISNTPPWGAADVNQENVIWNVDY